MDYNVYNYLSSNYVQRSMNKYDVHKKSELRSVVAEMLHLSKDSPLFLVNLSDEKQNYAVDIKELAMDMGNSITTLHEDEEKSVFERREAFSDNENAITATVVDQEGTLPPAFDIQVKQMAVAQQNVTKELYERGKGLKEGTYSFVMQVGNDSCEFQYRIHKEDRHKDILEGLSAFINAADAGVRASVDFGGKEEKVSMVLTSTQAGTAKNFTFADKGVGDGIASYYQLNRVVREGTDAKAIINGQEKTSHSNTFIANKTVSISMHGCTESTVHVDYRPDAQAITQGVRSVLYDYNQMIEKTNAYAKKTGYTSRLRNELKQVVRPYANELEAAGIRMEENGKLSIDDQLLYESARGGEMEELFDYKRPDSFAARLRAKAHEVKMNPMEYVDKTMVAYPNTSKPARGYAYITSMYSGMLFNSYC